MQHLIYAQDGPVSLRPLEPDDAGLLLQWLTDRRVLEYWEGSSAVFTPERIQEDFYDDEWNASRCIIQYDGQDIGYLHAYELDEELLEEYEYPRRLGKVFGIDQFIGKPELWGQGIGKAFVRLICRYLEDKLGAEAVILDPHTDNERAIQCYAACGFKQIKFLPEHELHDGKMVDCWLMERLKSRKKFS